MTENCRKNDGFTATYKHNCGFYTNFILNFTYFMQQSTHINVNKSAYLPNLQRINRESASPEDAKHKMSIDTLIYRKGI